MEQVPLDARGRGEVYLALWDGSLDATPTLLKYALSTMQSPASPRITIIYRGYDFHSIDARRHSGRPRLFGLSQDKRERETPWPYERLGRLREVRDFQLVLRADVRESLGECVVQILKEAATAYKEKGEFGDISSTNRRRPTALWWFMNCSGPCDQLREKTPPSTALPLL